MSIHFNGIINCLIKNTKCWASQWTKHRVKVHPLEHNVNASSILFSANLTIVGVRFELLLVPHTSGLDTVLDTITGNNVKYCHTQSPSWVVLSQLQCTTGKVFKVLDPYLFLLSRQYHETIQVSKQSSSSQFHHVTHTAALHSDYQSHWTITFSML